MQIVVCDSSTLILLSKIENLNLLPEFNTIEVCALENDRYKLFSCAEGQGVVKSKVIEGLQVDIKDIFED